MTNKTVKKEKLQIEYEKLYQNKTFKWYIDFYFQPNHNIIKYTIIYIDNYKKMYQLF